MVLSHFLRGDTISAEAMADSEELPSEYKSRFKRSVRSAVGVTHAENTQDPALPVMETNEVNRVIEVGNKIHELGGRGLSRWESKDYPGVAAVQTVISASDAVSELAESLGKKAFAEKVKQVKENETAEKTIYVLFSSIPGYFGFLKADGSTHTAFDIAVERVAAAMSRTVNGVDRGKPVDIDVYCMGSTLTMGGQVTEALVKDFESDPFGTQAKIDAERLKDIMDKNPKAKIVCLGDSWGGAEAVEAVKELEKIKDVDIEERVHIEYQRSTTGTKVEFDLERSRVRAMVNEPTPLWGGNQLFTGAVKSALSDLLSRYDDYLAKLWFPGRYRDWLVKRGLMSNEEDVQQTDLKKRGCKSLRKALSKGSNLPQGGTVFPEYSRVWVTQAVNDATLNTDVKEKLRELIHPADINTNAELFPRNGNHLVNRFKDTTIRRINQMVKRILAGN